MLRQTHSRRAMLRCTATALNFFPMGMKRGPLNPEIRHTRRASNFCQNAVQVPALKDSGFTHTSRDRLTLHCPDCVFTHYLDRTAVTCVQNPEHNQIEDGLLPTWIWGKQLPYKFRDQLRLTIHPKTKEYMGFERDEPVGGKLSYKGVERKAAGLTTQNRTRRTGSHGINRRAQNLQPGNYTYHTSARWRIAYPFAG